MDSESSGEGPGFSHNIPTQGDQAGCLRHASLLSLCISRAPHLSCFISGSLPSAAETSIEYSDLILWILLPGCHCKVCAQKRWQERLPCRAEVCMAEPVKRVALSLHLSIRSTRRIFWPTPSTGPHVATRMLVLIWTYYLSHTFHCFLSLTSSMLSKSLKVIIESGHSLTPDRFHPMSMSLLFSGLRQHGFLKALLLSTKGPFDMKFPLQKPLPVTFTFTSSQAGYPSSFFPSQGSPPNKVITLLCTPS